MIVMKFGGTSVGGATQITCAARLIREQYDQQPVVVVSAISGVTDLLLEAYNSDLDQRKQCQERLAVMHAVIIDELWPDATKSTSHHAYVAGQLKRLSRLLTLPRSRALRDQILGIGEILSSY